MCALTLLVVYTVWAIQQLNYLSVAQAFGVFALSWFTLPVFFILTSFLFALPFFIMIPLIYLGYQWIRPAGRPGRANRLFNSTCARSRRIHRMPMRTTSWD